VDGPPAWELDVGLIVKNKHVTNHLYEPRTLTDSMDKQPN
jgi:hypothetical protein